MLKSINSLKELATEVKSLHEVSWKEDFQYYVLSERQPEAARPQLIDPFGLCGDQIRQWIKTNPSQGQKWNCYFSGKVCVSGIGSLSVEGAAILDSDLVASYWKREYLNPQYSNFLAEVDLPVREVHDMCVCVVSWGWNIYGHFLIDALPRLLAIKEAFGGGTQNLKILLRDDTPSWFTSILTNDLGFNKINFEFFDPKSERVLLKRGIFPAYGYQNGVFQPAIKRMFSSATSHFRLPKQKGRKIFVSRLNLPEHRKNIRGCKNEAELCDIAENDFGYEIFVPEVNSWRRQIEAFHEAKLVVGLTGSGLHTSIFCNSDLTVGFVGSINLVQCHIASLTQQKFGALVDGVVLGRNFEVNKDDFKKFLRGFEKNQLSY